MIPKWILEVGKSRVLHTTHLRPDCDGIASVLWGVRKIGGDCYIPPGANRSARGLLRYLDLECVDEIDPSRYDMVVIYDTEKLTDASHVPESLPYAVVDHHPGRDEEFLKRASLVYLKKASANVVNLYEISQTAGFELEDDLRMAFAAALYTDTHSLRTAREGELKLFAEFLSSHRMEELLELVNGEGVNEEDFKRAVSSLRTYEVGGLFVGVTSCGDIDTAYSLVDGVFNVMNLDVLIAVVPKGSMIFMKKKHVQKVYHMRILPLMRKLGVVRDRGIWLGFKDWEKILEVIGGGHDLGTT